MRPSIGQISLIINADDYAYFECVSRGIIEGAKAGVVTAAGIMANSPKFDECIDWLQEVPDLDLGVHLNTTYGQPISDAMADMLQFNNGVFPDKFTVVKSLISKKIQIADVIQEWTAQILHCMNHGIRIRFLNSHEHMHMFPVLFTETLRLARDFDIPYVRFSTPEWRGKPEISSIVRNTLMQAMSLANTGKVSDEAKLPFLGMSESGKLNIDYIKRLLAGLKPGKTYELMCHPGRFHPKEIRDPKLCEYHHWEAELNMLKSQEFQDICNEFGVQLVRYRELNGKGSNYEKR